MPEPDVSVTYPRDKQCLVIFTGDGRVIHLDDASSHRWPSETFAPIERAVVVARLRAWADLIEQDDQPDLLAQFAAKAVTA